MMINKYVLYTHLFFFRKGNDGLPFALALGAALVSCLKAGSDILLTEGSSASECAGGGGGGGDAALP